MGITPAFAQTITNSTGTYVDGVHVSFVNGTAVPPPPPPPEPDQPPEFVQLNIPLQAINYNLTQFPDQTYNLIDNGDTITIETKGISAVYDKDTCSLTMYNPGELDTVIAKESYSVHSSPYHDDSWTYMSVNDEICETGFVNSQDSASITALRQNADGVFTVHYMFDIGGLKSTVS